MGINKVCALIGAAGVVLLVGVVLLWFAGIAPLTTRRYLDVHSGRERVTEHLFVFPIGEQVKETEFSRVALAEGLIISGPQWSRFATYTWPDNGYRISSETGRAFSELKTLSMVFVGRSTPGPVKARIAREVLPLLATGASFEVDYDYAGGGDPVGINGKRVVAP